MEQTADPNFIRKMQNDLKKAQTNQNEKLVLDKSDIQKINQIQEDIKTGISDNSVETSKASGTNPDKKNISDYRQKPYRTSNSMMCFLSAFYSIFKSVEYVLQATSLIDKDCDKIDTMIHKTLLPKLRVVHSMSIAYRSAPSTFASAAEHGYNIGPFTVIILRDLVKVQAPVGSNP